MQRILVVALTTMLLAGVQAATVAAKQPARGGCDPPQGLLGNLGRVAGENAGAADGSSCSNRTALVGRQLPESCGVFEPLGTANLAVGDGITYTLDTYDAAIDSGLLDWGDGTAAPISVPANTSVELPQQPPHTYTQPGTYQLSLVDLRGSFPDGTPCANDRVDIGTVVVAEPPSADTDGDGLFDHWETGGIDQNGDGKPEVDLPAMGADPQHKDIFIELDAMSNHELARAALDRVVRSFADAPVTNPDGRSGIRLHIDAGATSIMNPVTGEAWGSRSRSDTVGHQDVLGSSSGSNYDWSAFDAVKKAHFDPDRARAFRYALSVHQYGSATNDSSGIARGIPASDFVVALGRTCPGGVDCTVGGVGGQAGTFMHELGHTLGLRHGGDADVPQYEPNYVSIMNYLFQFGGLWRAGAAAPTVDYSRYGPNSGAGTIANLDENALLEPVGIAAAGQATGLQSVRYCGTSATVLGPFALGASVDWDCNPATTGTVSASINKDAKTEMLTAFDDWPTIKFKGGAIGSPGAAVSLPARTPVTDDVPVQQLQRTAAVLARDNVAPRVRVTRDAKRRRLVMRATDNKAISQLIVRVNGRQRVLTGRNARARKIAATLRLRRGRNRITATAFDNAGNRARGVRASVRG